MKQFEICNNHGNVNNFLSNSLTEILTISYITVLKNINGEK